MSPSTFKISRAGGQALVRAATLESPLLEQEGPVLPPTSLLTLFSQSDDALKCDL